MKNLQTARQSGFTLIELMIVVAIIGIIAAIAYPSYLAQVESTRRGDAQGALASFANAMERYYTQNNTYIGADGGNSAISDTLTAPAAGVFASQSPADGTPFYNLRIFNLTANSYELRAVPIAGSAQAGDGFLQLTSTGQRGWDADNSGALSGTENTWSK
ncbi:prepilin-type N-terminal cleavage/methylation domain-containing protein [Marinobacter lipolyticus]|uniref:type IV pilin protein n=1 Tax=Marinobacter lipolyticus TaxID=209639 RepID=UPI001BCF20B7|nr:type IV pilin protein [Marinobacter lipolyticus]MBS8241176.1 prepilin-type N-terminal cleavage/methylation domain-containing protein [Marinobacter lipolyticus]